MDHLKSGPSTDQSPSIHFSQWPLYVRQKKNLNLRPKTDALDSVRPDPAIPGRNIEEGESQKKLARVFIWGDNWWSWSIRETVASVEDLWGPRDWGCTCVIFLVCLSGFPFWSVEIAILSVLIKSFDNGTCKLIKSTPGYIPQSWKVTMFI